MCAPATLDETYSCDYDRMLLSGEDDQFDPAQELIEDPYIRLPFLRPDRDALALARQIEIDRLSNVISRLRQLQAQLYSQREELSQMLADITELRNDPETTTDIDEPPASANDTEGQDNGPAEQEQANTSDGSSETHASSLKRKTSEAKDKTAKKHKQEAESETP